MQNFEYELATTPCRAVVGRVSRFVGTGVNVEFAPGTLFAAKGFDSYAAHSLMSSTGEQLGMVVALDRAALTDQALTEALLKIFAARAAAEIERTRAEQSYREIFDAAEDAIFVHDWDTGAIIDVSAKAADLYGHTREALKRLRVGDISANVPPYTEADAMAHIERAKQSDCAAALRVACEAPRRHARCGTRSRSSARRLAAIAACLPSCGTSRNARRRRTRCRCANASTARSSTVPSMRWCCGTTRFASSTSIAHSPRCTASRARR